MNNQMILESVAGVLQGVPHVIANLANTASLLWDNLPDINWAGFYLLSQGELWLGPFQGKVACTRIAPGRGVCGSALAQDRTLVVPDVHAFPGHIACDAASRSEIVVPLHAFGRPVGVLDIDSPILDRFTAQDRDLLEKIAQLLELHCDFSRCGFDLQL